MLIIIISIFIYKFVDSFGVVNTTVHLNTYHAKKAVIQNNQLLKKLFKNF